MQRQEHTYTNNSSGVSLCDNNLKSICTNNSPDLSIQALRLKAVVNACCFNFRMLTIHCVNHRPGHVLCGSNKLIPTLSVEYITIVRNGKYLYRNPIVGLRN